MMAGAALQRERWATVLQLPVLGTLSAPHLADFDEVGAASCASGGIPAGSILVNARFVPRLRAPSLGDAITGVTSGSESPDLWISGGRAVAVRTTRELPVEHFADGQLALDEIARSGAEAAMLEGRWLEHVWDFIRILPEQLAEDIAYLEQARFMDGLPQSSSPPAHVTVIGDHQISVVADRVAGGERILKGAAIEPYVILDASAGPIYVSGESVIHSFTRINGPCYIGRRSTVLGGELTACAIGDVCKVRGELSNTIVLGHSNKGHDGFVGHSYLGRWVNLGAGTITSNLKNTYGNVQLWTPDGLKDTGMQFLGTLFGDHAKTGIGVRLTTGTVVGAGANVYGSNMPPKAVPPFAWGEQAPYLTYRLDKFLEVAARMMSRRHVVLSDRARRQLTSSHAARWSA
jgi:UDP-N-acetylglucosamine diphosphorylase/glucosamine-1-phosphate N-acetyltransferase